MIKNHGREKKGTFKHEIIGWNFSFTEMQAALGISQMKKLDQIISIKKKIFNFYKENISNEKLYMRPVPKTTTSPVHWFSNIHCSNADKLEIGERCASTSNRNFEGRQGKGGRTHLVSPEMAVAAAVNGYLSDVRKLI